MSIQIQIRRGIASDWTSADPVLAYGEIGLETDTYQFKWGDGVTAWTALAYFGTGFGTGTVTSVNVTTANGVSATGGPITTAGSFTFSLGAITPSSVAASGTVTGSNLSGTNTGDQTITLTGDVTGSGTGSFAATIANDAVTFAKFQNITTARLLGRATGGSGDMEEITLGTGLSYAGTTLNVSGFSSSTLVTNHIFVGNGSNLATDVAMSGDATIVASGALTLASILSAGGPTGSATVTPIITWDAKGRLTAVSSATITPAASSITGGAALTKTDDTNVTLTLGGSPSTALLAASSLTLGWTGLLSGTRGGTGVNNGSNTITVAGNFVTSGAFSLTLTTTATTNVTLPTTGTLATLAGTETFTNKTIGVTQLNGGAYTMAVNNTNATANYTAVTFQYPGQQTYAGTATWTGTTAPSGATTHTYAWSQIGKTVNLEISLVYASAGTALTVVSMTLPTDCPAPLEPSGLGGASEKLYSAVGYIDTGKGGNPGASRAWMRVNSGDTGWDLAIISASQNALVANISIQYFAA